MELKIKYEKIKVPYFFSKEEQSIIADNYKDAKDWNNKHLLSVKKSLRRYLRFVQGNQCCYCKRDLPWDMKSVDIEHIVNKDDHWTFGFEPKNLALCCPACNSCKTAQETMVDKDQCKYPTISSAFKIVHPYFDNYSENIEINFPLYSASSIKGENTIKMCKLNRLAEVEKRQKDYNIKKGCIDNLLAIDIPEADKENVFHLICDFMKEG